MIFKKCINYVLADKEDIPILHRSIESVRQFCDYDINILTTYDSIDVEGFFRHGNVNMLKVEKIHHDNLEKEKNISRYSLISLLISGKSYHVSLYLNNNVIVNHKDFLHGFNICQTFGLTMIHKSRDFMTSDESFGMPSYDTDIIFYNSQHFSSFFLGSMLEEQNANPGQIQLGLYRTIDKHKFAPFGLPEGWVCPDSERSLVRKIDKKVFP